jgi:hypothetical protein
VSDVCCSYSIVEYNTTFVNILVDEDGVISKQRRVRIKQGWNFEADATAAKLCLGSVDCVVGE